MHIFQGCQIQIQLWSIRNFCITCVLRFKLRRICYTNSTDQKTLPLFLVVVMRAVGVVEDSIVDKEVVGFIVVGFSVVG